MKKILVTFLAVFCAFTYASAQDLEQVTTIYNNAATAINDDNKDEAIKLFEQALEGATALGEEGNEIAGQCKEVLPKLYSSVAKDALSAKDYEGALAKIEKAVEVAKKFNSEDIVAELGELTPKVYIGIGAAKLAAGNTDAAVEAFEKAKELGQDEIANKQLSNIFIKKAAAAQKAKDAKGALEAAQKSLEYLNNPTAQKIVGLSALSLKQNKVAVDALEAYLSLSPNAKDKVQIIYQLGTALVAAGDNGKACGYFKQIAQDAKWGEAARYQITTLKCN